ncbi:MAG: hypothetical protein GX654_03965 [Desulfatiglans sp.]|nr:hypothetical protein [Desulfatiglans sp.]
MTVAEPLSITRIIAKVFEDLKIPYFIGGSLASSLYGIPRATQDVDIVADIKKEDVSVLVDNLKDRFYIDQDMIFDALHRKSSFNVIHLKTMFKVDVFILGRDDLSKEEIGRKDRYQLSDDPLDQIFLASAEDVLLHKLYWYKLGGYVSERQWNDVIGILQVQSGRLDIDYLVKRAEQRGVSELLEKALKEQSDI